MTREVYRSCLRRFICPAQDHFIFLTLLIMTFVPSLTQMLVIFYPCMLCLAYFFQFWSVHLQVCSVLVWSVTRSSHHMLFTCCTAWLVVSQWFLLLHSVFQGYLDLFSLLSHFPFSSALLPLPMPLLVVLLRGLFVLLPLVRRQILSRIILFVS